MSVFALNSIFYDLSHSHVKICMPNFNLRASSRIWASLARTRGKNVFTVTVPLCSNACQHMNLASFYTIFAVKSL